MVQVMRPCGNESEQPCHLDCATVGEWNASRRNSLSKGETEMEPITREVYLAVLSMLGAKAEDTVSVHMYRDHVEIETITDSPAFYGKELATERRVVPVIKNGYISRVRG